MRCTWGLTDCPVNMRLTNISQLESQWIVDPTDSNIAPHLSLPHAESVGGRNILRPSRRRPMSYCMSGICAGSSDIGLSTGSIRAASSFWGLLTRVPT